MTDRDLILFKHIVSSQENSLLKTLPEFLKKHYKKIYANEKFIYAVGEVPVLLVAHLDTVFSHPVRELYHDKEQHVLWSPQGLGADDRAGVFAILEIIQRGYRPSILFTTQEETGAKGAKFLLTKHRKPMSNFNFMIELDRQGYNDCVFYDLDNPEFEKYISSFGFNVEVGIFSDITLIAPGWKIPGVNLSIGYQHEHSLGEVLHYDHMYETIDKVCKILDAEKIENHKFTWKKYNVGSVLENG